MRYRLRLGRAVTEDGRLARRHIQQAAESQATLNVFMQMGRNSDKIPDTLKVSMAACTPNERDAVVKPRLS